VDLSRWAVLVCWRSAPDATAFDAGPVARAWRRLATAHCRLDLTPIASRGTWSGQTPFTPPSPPALNERASAEPGGPAQADGTVVAITRARLRPAKALRFWGAIRPVAADVQATPGLLAAFGIGEAPLGWQGTVSVWRDAAHLRRFAYDGAAHAEVVARTPRERWYAEELFARFALLRVEGDPEVLGWAR
jgi:hypothetical protein